MTHELRLRRAEARGESKRIEWELVPAKWLLVLTAVVTWYCAYVSGQNSVLRDYQQTVKDLQKNAQENVKMLVDLSNQINESRGLPDPLRTPGEGGR